MGVADRGLPRHRQMVLAVIGADTQRCATMRNDTLDTESRVITASDRDAIAFAVHSWMQSSKGKPPFRWMETSDYWGDGTPGLDHHSLVEYALTHPRTVTTLVTVAGEPDLFVGWSCVEPASNCLHYVYLKDASRRCGVFTKLLAEATQRGMDVPRLRYSSMPDRETHEAWKQRGWRYTPHALWGLR